MNKNIGVEVARTATPVQLVPFPVAPGTGVESPERLTGADSSERR